MAAWNSTSPPPKAVACNQHDLNNNNTIRQNLTMNLDPIDNTTAWAPDAFKVLFDMAPEPSVEESLGYYGAWVKNLDPDSMHKDCFQTFVHSVPYLTCSYPNDTVILHGYRLLNVGIDMGKY